MKYGQFFCINFLTMFEGRMAIFPLLVRWYN